MSQEETVELPSKDRTCEEVTLPSKSVAKHTLPFLGGRALRSLWLLGAEPDLRSPRFADMPTESRVLSVSLVTYRRGWFVQANDPHL